MGSKVLLVEDSPSQALRTRLILESQGFKVVSAEDGQRALDVARRVKPDVILSDVLMEGMDGFQLCLEVRLDPELRSIPFVLYSASFHSEEDRAFAFRLGADGYVEKDISPEELETVLGAVTTRAGRPPVSVGAATSLDERTFRGEYGERLMSRLMREAAKLERAHEALSAAYDATLLALVSALDLRDTDTELHSWRVTNYACAIGRGLGIDGESMVDLERGALLHDIGKIGIPDHILRKPGPLDDQEWGEMRKHPLLGFRMVSHIEFLKGAAQVILCHHEQWDGRGYPRGLEGEAIPLIARVFAVADAIDAITSDRPYRKARGFDAALGEIERMSGDQFDPSVAETALAVPPGEWEHLRHGLQERQGEIIDLRPVIR